MNRLYENATGSQANDSLNWFNKYQELLEYRRIYGHCYVPYTNETQSLFLWVQEQRDEYFIFNMSEERIARLNDIGFDWWTAQPRDSIVSWNDKFEQLKIYKSKHGHCNVQRNYKENQPLANWVHYQRAYKHSKLSEEHINMLNDIGFDWTVQTRDSIAWNDKFEELKQYKTKKGDCKVPSTYKENQPLANWVNRQRSQYKQLKLSEERIERLNDICFDWTAKTRDSIWNVKFEHLQQYKAKHGDCKVPTTYEENQPLANWVQRQRSNYKQLKLSEERIARLNDIGFDWNAWYDKFEELKQYKTKKGDCKVPSIYKENQPLANWVSWQRYRYRISRLSEEHINMLNDIGFDWTVPPKASKTAQTEINTEQEDNEIKQNHEQLAIEINSIESTIDTTTQEKVETPCTRTLQGRIQVLCKLSLMFRKQKDAIYANMKKRKLDNSALSKISKPKKNL